MTYRVTSRMMSPKVRSGCSKITIKMVVSVEYRWSCSSSSSSNDGEQAEVTLHATRVLMNAATEKMATCTHCRSGGMLVDYGAVSLPAVLEAEEAEAAARMTEKAKHDA
uniref:Protein transport protein Sec16B n=1 Tax=Lygus hesperus TaxID=30085 RepID=A0A0A9W8B9_LYGHE